MQSVYSFDELLEKLPDKIRTKKNIHTKEFDYFLLITKTEKTKWFVLPDWYVGYKNLDGKYLHSEREDSLKSAIEKMMIYLIKEKLIKIK